MKQLLKKHDLDYEIVVLSDEWFGLPFSCKHLLKHFLPDHRLIWVETIGLRSPKLNLYDLKRTITKISQWIFSVNKSDQQVIPKNLNIINPFQIPYNHFNVVRAINKSVLLRAINGLGDKAANRTRVFITTWPFVGNLVGRLGDRLSVYYRVDDFSEFPGVHKKRIIQLENELINKVDMIVATAKDLAKINIEGKKIRYLPHGVDFEHFSSRKNNDRFELPIQKISSPRIGFFGLLSAWVDFDLLSTLACMQRQWSFILIGPSQIPISQLPQAPNIHYLGAIPYQELPKHAQFFDIAMIPFKVNTLTRSVNPLKLMEYLSMGIPIVSTPLPEVETYRDYVKIASDPENFAKAVETSLEEDSPQLREARTLVAKPHSWKEKSLQLKNWIEEDLEDKIV